MKPEIIALAGRAGCGKDTVAAMLDEIGVGQVAIFAFADRLKAGLKVMLDIEIDRLSRTEKEAPIDDLPGRPSPRHLAQTLGTEWGRSVHPDLWVRLLARDVEEETRWMSERGLVLIAVVKDCRFPNEVAWVKSQGGAVWWIERDGMPGVRDHASEKAIGPQDCDRVVKNLGTLDDLRTEVRSAWENHWNARRAA